MSLLTSGKKKRNKGKNFVNIKVGMVLQNKYRIMAGMKAQEDTVATEKIVVKKTTRLLYICCLTIQQM